MGHLAPNKTRKQKNHLREAGFVSKTDMPGIRQMIDLQG
jgi:ribosomal protein L35